MWKYFDAILLGADLASGHFYRCGCAGILGLAGLRFLEVLRGTSEIGKTFIARKTSYAIDAE